MSISFLKVSDTDSWYIISHYLSFWGDEISWLSNIRNFNYMCILLVNHCGAVSPKYTNNVWTLKLSVKDSPRQGWPFSIIWHHQNLVFSKYGKTLISTSCYIFAGIFLNLPHHHHNLWSDVNCRLTEGCFFWHFPQMRFSSVRLLSLRHFHQPKSTSRAHFGGQLSWSGERRSLEPEVPAGEHQHIHVVPGLGRHYGGVQYPNTRSAVNITLCLLHYLTKWKQPPGSRSLLCQWNLTFFFSPVKRDFN